MPIDDVEICDICGASVYPEHIDSGKAGSVDGRLRCTHCWAEFKATHVTESPALAGQPNMRAPGEGDSLESIAMVNDQDMGMSSTHIRAIGGETAEFTAQHDDSVFKRPLNATGRVATRCRTFHARLNDGAIAFMNRQINDWVDEHAEIAIKFATSTIGIFEGKKAEPALIVTVFY